MNKKVILGLGKTGISVAKFFKKRSIPFCICDTREVPPLLTVFKQNFSEVDIYTGGFPEAVLQQSDEIIISPGIASNHPDLQSIATQQKLISDIELFARVAKAPIVAITGSNGKSTVTTLVGEMAKNAGLQVGVGGNLGIPALDLIDLFPEADAYILELSSFQLEHTYSLKSKIATILNISPDHLDRYANFEQYITAKKRIYQGAENILICRDDALTANSTCPSTDTVVFTFGLSSPKTNWEYGLINFQQETWLAKYDKPIIPQANLALFGQHNIRNALAAIALAEAIAIPYTVMTKTLETFKGLPHRCEWVAKLNQVIWINDSKGTNVGATLSALQGLEKDIQGKWILIAGGVGKNADFSPLKPIVQKNCRAVVVMGEAAHALQNLFAPEIPSFLVSGMEEAVNQSAQIVKPGDGVLLSPACASLDMFKNYEERGDIFKRCVLDLMK